MYHKLELSMGKRKPEARGQTSLPPSALGVGRSPFPPVPSGYPSFGTSSALEGGDVNTASSPRPFVWTSAGATRRNLAMSDANSRTVRGYNAAVLTGWKLLVGS